MVLGDFHGFSIENQAVRQPRGPFLAQDSFVNASTAYAELGSLRVVSAAGDCVSCAALCSSPDEPENEARRPF